MTEQEYLALKNWLALDKVKQVHIKPNADGTKYIISMVTPLVTPDGKLDEYTIEIKKKETQ